MAVPTREFPHDGRDVSWGWWQVLLAGLVTDTLTLLLVAAWLIPEWKDSSRYLKEPQPFHKQEDYQKHANTPAYPLYVNTIALADASKLKGFPVNTFCSQAEEVALARLGENNPGRKIQVHEMLLLVTIDFLTRILKHANSQIMQERFTIIPSEIVICVPVIWSQRAIRNMQTCMSIAAKLAGFPGIRHEDDCIGNVFIVSEPEAAATWLLAHGSGIRASPGGGTCDALTYTVTREMPVRLRKQQIRHTGDYCGSKALNEGVHRLVFNLLKDHTYLERDGVTIAGITHKLIDHDFDKMKKPSWSAYGENYDW
ncbi:hypothetical protein BKA59DRAFT_513026 [Fusarium tricinctum]|uniref:Uncharacterized protein n=1 Tax=Fusarium tricinctum TaxID=61284 RepID=A0A8K0RS40_9HYPO|nr:hypothetical protein BKA59DRAFT_513026 [Fusarium tricinctum]